MRVNRADKTNIYALSGEYGHVVSGHVEKLGSGEVFIDVGTNYGLFSLLAANRVGRDGHVFAFEPNPEIYRFFLDNLHLNQARNVIPFHCAIGPEEGLLGLTFDAGHSGKSHLSDQGTFLVPVFNPARWQFLTERIGTRPIHIKIDVEGFEAGILKALMTASWFANVKSIIVEIDDENLKSFGETAASGIYAPLQALGFQPTIRGKIGIHYDEIFTR